MIRRQQHSLRRAGIVPSNDGLIASAAASGPFPTQQFPFTMPVTALIPLPSAPVVDRSPTRAELGLRAAAYVTEVIASVLKRQPRARVMFACAPSQDEFLEQLAVASRGVIDWSRVSAFHMDEYVGVAATHPASFRSYLRTHVVDRLPGLQDVAWLRGDAPDPAAECERYGALLATAPMDLICLGIGENGHIAFNDPPVADFDDSHGVKVVELDLACRQQQVNDGCFPTLSAVPTHALTVTIPTFRRALALSVVVPGPRKAAAVRATMRDPITTACPATILRTHPRARLFVDHASASQLD